MIRLRSSLLGSALLVTLLVPFSARVAQTASDGPKGPVVSMSDRNVLKIGFGPFERWWVSQKTDFMNSSEASLDACAAYYARIRHRETDRELNRVPPEARHYLGEVRSTLLRWTGERWGTEGLYQGGGTLYTHMSARSAAAVEDLIGLCIRRFNVEIKHDRTDRFYARAKQRLGETRPKPAYLSAADYVRYRQAMTQLHEDLDRIQEQTIHLPLPDQYLISQYVASIDPRVHP